jgi:hypothetical protein
MANTMVGDTNGWRVDYLEGVNSMAEQWFEDLKAEILSHRMICESCYDEPATQLHHCLVHDLKKFHRELTVAENLMPVGEKCHTSLKQNVNGIKVKMRFAVAQKARGYDVGGWYRNLPFKFKEEKWLLWM